MITPVALLFGSVSCVEVGVIVGFAAYEAFFGSRDRAEAVAARAEADRARADMAYYRARAVLAEGESAALRSLLCGRPSVGGVAV